MPNSDPKPLSDAIKLAIREDVESEVIKRVAIHQELSEQREKYYTIIVGMVGGFVSLISICFAIFFGYEAKDMPRKIEEKFADTGVSNAIAEIFNIQTNAQISRKDLNQIVLSVDTNRVGFLERLNEIKKEDNVVLVDDLPKLFVIQTITNLTDGRKIVLNYEPIPLSIKFIPSQTWDLAHYGYLDGRTIVLTNNSDGYFQGLANPDNLKIGAFQVEYMRKNPR